MLASVQTQFFQCRPPRPDKVISEIALFVGAHDGGGIEREREREREREKERDRHSEREAREGTRVCMPFARCRAPSRASV
jgi:hypothetical protein